MVHPAAPAPPVWHLAPPDGWMNDPNGLILADGRWHAYYQHHPYTDRWGPMHWGHASSADGLRWQHHPIALAPDDLGTIFSGSIVVDTDGVAGLGRGTWLAFFTHHTDTRQSQSMASSTDGGVSWVKYPGNPIIPGEVADFRDPKVCAMPDGGWCMVVTFADHLAFFATDDLVHWVPIGTFTADLGADAGNWECPDLLPLSDGRWALFISLSTGGVQGHSGIVVLVGDFRDGVFTPHGPPQRFDHGPDCYAWQTFHGAPADEMVGMAWVNSWASAHQVPSAGRRGLLTVPRRVRIGPTGALHQWPAVHPPSPIVDVGARWIESDGDVSVTIHGVGGEVRASVRGGRAVIERSGAHAPGYDGRYEADVEVGGPNLVVVDHGVVELFAGGGSAALTAQVFAGPSPLITVG